MNDIRKEVFVASVAERVDIFYYGDEMSAEDWVSNRRDELKEMIGEIGLDAEYIVDMEIVSDNHVQVFILTGSHIEVGDEKDFRGYIIPKGDTIVLDDNVIESLNKANSYGEYRFECGEYFDIIEVRHDDINNKIEYYLKCYVESVKPVSIDIR